MRWCVMQEHTFKYQVTSPKSIDDAARSMLLALRIYAACKLTHPYAQAAD